MRARQHDRGRTLSNREDTGGGCVDPRTKEVGAPPSVSSNLQKKKTKKKKKWWGRGVTGRSIRSS